MAIIFSIAGADYFYRALHHNQSSSPTLRYLIVLIIFAIVMGWLSASRRRAERSLCETRNELEVKVAERTVELRRAASEALAA